MTCSWSIPRLSPLVNPIQSNFNFNFSSSSVYLFGADKPISHTSLFSSVKSESFIHLLSYVQLAPVPLTSTTTTYKLPTLVINLPFILYRTHFHSHTYSVSTYLWSRVGPDQPWGSLPLCIVRYSTSGVTPRWRSVDLASPIHVGRGRQSGKSKKQNKSKDHRVPLCPW